jgi:hypothetical protein
VINIKRGMALRSRLPLKNLNNAQSNVPPPSEASLDSDLTGVGSIMVFPNSKLRIQCSLVLFHTSSIRTRRSLDLSPSSSLGKSEYVSSLELPRSIRSLIQKRNARLMSLTVCSTGKSLYGSLRNDCLLSDSRMRSRNLRPNIVVSTGGVVELPWFR